MKGRIHIFIKHPNGDVRSLCGRLHLKDNRHVKDAYECKTCAEVQTLMAYQSECGRLIQLPSGRYSLEYRVNGTVHRLPLDTCDRKKADTLRPLIMKMIQRIGIPIAKGPQCFADKA